MLEDNSRSHSKQQNIKFMSETTININKYQNVRYKTTKNEKKELKKNLEQKYLYLSIMIYD